MEGQWCAWALLVLVVGTVWSLLGTGLWRGPAPDVSKIVVMRGGL
jgi:hypothetical protein